MKKTIKEIIKKIKELSASEEYAERHKRGEKDFVRKRKLSYTSIIEFILGKVGSSFDFEIAHFSPKSKITAAAMSKARDKIKFTAFAEMLRETAKEIPVKNKYKGYRLKAIDGMKGELPRTPELMEKYRPYKEAGYPQFHAIAVYDVLNCCYTDAVFAPAPTDERKAASDLILADENENAEIFLLDRGFPSIHLIQQLEAKGKKYLFRVSKSFLKEVNDFGEQRKNDAEIAVEYSKRRAAVSRIKGDFPYVLHLRCVKIKLPTETEVLVTNLPKKEFSRKEIGELYNLRWKIETAFLNLKYAIRIEDFLGKKENSIKQEFFAALIQANIFMQFAETANTVIQNKKNYIQAVKAQLQG